MKNSAENLKSELKSLKAQKGLISKQFKHVDKDSTQFKELKVEIGGISSRIKNIESKLKKLLQVEPDDQVSKQEPIIEEPGLFCETESIFGQPFEINMWLGEEVPPEWWSWLETHNQLLYQQRRFIDLLASDFQLTVILVAAKDTSGNFIGGVTLLMKESKLFGRFATSIPHVNYGGIVTQFKDVEQRLLEQVPTVCGRYGLKRIEIRSARQATGKIPASTKKVSMLRSLPNSIEELDKQLGSKIRSQIKKAERFKPAVRFGREELLDDFYHVFSTNMRDLGTPVYPKCWFSKLLNQFPESTEVCIVYMDESPVSCGFLMANGDLVEIPWASTLKSANKFNMNMWMYHQILHHCITKHAKWFDFGRSTVDAGTFKFKKQWGAKPRQLYWYMADTNEFRISSDLTPDNPKFRLAIACWQKLPVWLANIIGPRIISHLS